MEKRNDLTKRRMSVEEFATLRAFEEMDSLNSLKERRYEMEILRDLKKQEETISINGFISIDDMSHFLREINSYWQHIPPLIQRVIVDARQLRYAGSTFYSLIAVMSAEHKTKYNNQKLTLITNRDIESKIRLLCLNKILNLVI